MLFEAIFLSVIVLAVVNLGFRSKRWGPRVAFGCLAFFLVGPVLFYRPLSGSFLWHPRPVLGLQGIALYPLALAGARRGWSAKSFFALSVGATLGVYAVTFVEPYLTQLQYAEFRQQYPFESMEQRLPIPSISPGDSTLPTATRRDLEELEKALGEQGPGFRPRLLRRIHEEHWDAFINSPGFGELRRFRPSEETLRPEPYPATPVPQPGPPFPPRSSAGDLAETEDGSLFDLHRTGFLDFVNVEGFGYVKSRRQVAGFQPHGFRAVPEAEAWKVRRVDLIGLLLHEKPVVYLTNGLPRMDRATRAPTRPPDAFESLGLPELAKGEDLVVREVPQGVRMLGALRSIEQCVECHGGRRGDLLGAFSYHLVREPLPRP